MLVGWDGNHWQERESTMARGITTKMGKPSIRDSMLLMILTFYCSSHTYASYLLRKVVQLWGCSSIAYLNRKAQGSNMGTPSSSSDFVILNLKCAAAS